MAENTINQNNTLSQVEGNPHYNLAKVSAKVIGKPEMADKIAENILKNPEAFNKAMEIAFRGVSKKRTNLTFEDFQTQYYEKNGDPFKKKNQPPFVQPEEQFSAPFQDLPDPQEATSWAEQYSVPATEGNVDRPVADAVDIGAFQLTPASFDANSDGYDYDSAKSAGMTPDDSGHWSSRLPLSKEESDKLGLPEDSGLILKGKSHPTFDKTIKGEERAGYKVIKKGGRYYSVPSDAGDINPTQQNIDGLQQAVYGKYQDAMSRVAKGKSEEIASGIQKELQSEFESWQQNRFAEIKKAAKGLKSQNEIDKLNTQWKQEQEAKQKELQSWYDPILKNKIDESLKPIQEYYDQLANKDFEELYKKELQLAPENRVENENNPIVTGAKSLWNVLANQVPAGMASLAAVIAPERPANMFGMTATFTKAQEEAKATTLKNMPAARGELVKWSLNRQAKGAEFTKDLTNQLSEIEDPIDAVNWVSNAVGQAAGYIPLSVLTGGASSIGTEIGNIYSESVKRIAEKEGITPQEVIMQGKDDKASAMAFGFAAGMLDKVGAAQVMKSFGKEAMKQSLVKRALSGGLTEAPTEAVQTILEQVGVNLSAGDDQKLDWEEIGEAAAQGFAGGGALSSLSGIGGNQKQSTEQKNDTAQKPKSEPAPEVQKPQVQGAEVSAGGGEVSAAASQESATETEGVVPASPELTVSKKTQEVSDSATNRIQELSSQVAKSIEAEPMTVNLRPKGSQTSVRREINVRFEDVGNPDPRKAEFFDPNGKKITNIEVVAKAREQLITRFEKNQAVFTEFNEKLQRSQDEATRPLEVSLPGSKVKYRVYSDVNLARSKNAAKIREVYALEQSKKLVKSPLVEVNQEGLNEKEASEQYAGAVAEQSGNPLEIIQVMNEVAVGGILGPKLTDLESAVLQTRNTQRTADGSGGTPGRPMLSSEGISKREKRIAITEAASKQMKLHWFSEKDGTPIDVYAQELSDQLGREVTPDEILQVMADNPSGYYPKSQLEEQLEKRFEQITGLKPTNENFQVYKDAAARVEKSTATTIKVRHKIDRGEKISTEDINSLIQEGGISEEDALHLKEYLSYVEEVNQSEDSNYIKDEEANEGAAGSSIGRPAATVDDSGRKEDAASQKERDAGSDSKERSKVNQDSAKDTLTPESKPVSGKKVYSEAPGAGGVFEAKTDGRRNVYEITEIDENNAEFTLDVTNPATLPLVLNFPETTLTSHARDNLNHYDGNAEVITVVKPGKAKKVDGKWKVAEKMEFYYGKPPVNQNNEGVRSEDRSTKAAQAGSIALPAVPATAQAQQTNTIVNGIINRVSKAFPGLKISALPEAEFIKAFKALKGTEPATAPRAFFHAGNVYLNESKFTPDSPIHEVVHPFVDLMQIHYPALFRKGVELLKGTKWHKWAKDNYPVNNDLSKAEVVQQEVDQMKEAMAQFIAETGVNVYNQKFTSVSARIQSYLADFWATIKQAFGFKRIRPYQLPGLTLKEFGNLTATELLSGRPLIKADDKAFQRFYKQDIKYGTVIELREGLLTSGFSVADANSRAPKAMLRRFWEINISDIYGRAETIVKRNASKLTTENNFFQKLTLFKAKAAEKIEQLEQAIIKSKDPSKPALLERLIKDKLNVDDFGVFMYAQHAAERNAHVAKIRQEEFDRFELMLKEEVEYWSGKIEDEVEKGAKARQHLIDLWRTKVKEAEHELEILRAGEHPDHYLLPDGGSGMTNQEAEAHLQKFRDDNTFDKYEAYAKEFRDQVTQKNLENNLAAGLITQDQFADLSAKSPTRLFEFYVPLMVDPKFLAESNYSYGEGGSMVLGKPIKPVKGSRRYTADTRINPVDAAIAQFKQTAKNAEKNEVLISAYRFFQDNPDPSVATFRKEMPNMPLYDAAGEFVTMMSKEQKSPNEIELRVGGESMYMKVHDPKLLEALQQRDLSAVKGVFEVVRAVMMPVHNWLRMVNTGVNPEFIVTNLERDIQTAAINIAAEDVKGATRDLLKNTLSGAAFRGILAGEKGKSNTYWSKRYKELKALGGKTSWFQSVDAETAAKDLRSQLRDAEKNSVGKKKLSFRQMAALGNFLSRINTAAEMSTRLAAFDALVTKGVDPEKAAFVAKNLTVNFERKGTLGLMLDTFFLFANTSLQGSLVILKNIGKSQAVRKRVLAVFAFSLLVNMYNDWMDEDDEEYYLIPDGEKERKMIFMLPKSFSEKHNMDGSYVSVPLPYGFNVFKVMSDVVYEGAMGKRSIGSGLGYLMESFIGSFSPIGSNWTSMFTPTLLRPVTELTVNENFAGNPIKPEDGFGVKDKESDKYFNTTPSLFKDMSETLNSATGGNEFKEGVVSLSPETIEHVIASFTGGAGKFVMNTAETGSQLAEVMGLKEAEADSKYSLNNTPFLRQVFKEYPEWYASGYVYRAWQDSRIHEMNRSELKRFISAVEISIKGGYIEPLMIKRILNDVITNKIYHEVYNQDKEAGNTMMRFKKQGLIK